MSFPTPTITLHADSTRMLKDIGKPSGNTIRDDLVLRSNEDASTQLEAIFLNLVDFTLVATDNTLAWFVDLATELAVAMFWKKSNGTEEQKALVETILKKADTIKIDRFFPQEYR